jgi:hypothetical protein
MCHLPSIHVVTVEGVLWRVWRSFRDPLRGIGCCAIPVEE